MSAPFVWKMGRLLLLVSLCLAIVPLAGCWDRKEVNDIALVVGAGIDRKKDGRIGVTVQIIIPKAIIGAGGGMGGGGGGGEGQAKTFVRSTEAVTLAQAMQNLQEEVPRKIFWGHLKVLIFGEELAKTGIRDHLDFLARYVQPRLRTYVLVSKGKAADSLKIIPPIERSSADVLRELANFQFGLKVTVKDLLEMLSSDANAAALPYIEEIPANTSIGEKMGDKEHASLRLNGTAVFTNNKMAGHIDDSVTRGVLWLRDEIKFANITFKPKIQPTGFVSMYQLHSHTEIIPKIAGKRWEINVLITADEDIIQNTTNLNVMNPDIVEQLERQTEEDIAGRIRMTLQQVQKKLKADIFGFGDAFEREYPDQWDTVKGNWGEVFPAVQVNIQIHVKIRRPGVSTLPPSIPEDEVKAK